MSLGEAFIDVRADVSGFREDLAAKLRAALAGFQQQVNVVAKVTTAGARSAATGAETTAAAAVAAQESITAASKAAADTQIAEVARVEEVTTASYREIAKASRVAADQAVADRLREAQAARTAAFEEDRVAGLAADKAIQKYADTAHAARVSALNRIAAENAVTDAQFKAGAKLSILQEKERALARQRENVQARTDELAAARANRLDDASHARKLRELGDIAKARNALEKEQAQLERMTTAAGKLGDAEARAFGNIGRAQEALAKATAKQAVADEKVAKALLDRDAALARSNATNAESALALHKIGEAERALAAAAKETDRVIAEGAAQDAAALRALGAVAEETAAKIARVNAAGIAAPTTAAKGVAKTPSASAQQIAAARVIGANAAAEAAAERLVGVEAGNAAKAVVAAEILKQAALRTTTLAYGEETAAIRKQGAEEQVSARAAIAAQQLRAAAARAAAAEERATSGGGSSRPLPVFAPGNAQGQLAAQEALAKQAAQIAKDAADEQEIDFRAAAERSAEAERDFLAKFNAVMKATAVASREAAAAQTEAFAVSSRASALLSQETLAAARESDAARVASARAAAAAQKAAAKEASNSFTGKATSSFTDAIKGIPKDLFGALTTSAKFATIGVVGLGTALAGIGLVAAAKQQAALVSFTAFAPQIAATTNALTGFNDAANQYKTDLDGAQKVGSDFLQQLIGIANTSAISQTALQDTSQQLLALGFNGDQTVGIIKDIGNALAASGKTGGGLNDDLKGIVVAFSQIKGAGRLLAQDLNQITTRIPAATRVDVYRELAKNLGIAGAGAAEGTKAFKNMELQVQKLAKAGQIDANLGIASITKVLEQVPGAAKDATTGLDALGRQNLTLSGSFEALKDNIRNALAQAFLPVGGDQKNNPATNIAAEIQKAIPEINATIAKLGVPLAKFTSTFTETLLKALPLLAKLIGSTFGALGKGFDAVNKNLDSVVKFFKSDTVKNFFLSLAVGAKGLFDLVKSLLPLIAGFAAGFSQVSGAIRVVGDVAEALSKVIDTLFGNKFGVAVGAAIGLFVGARVVVGLLTRVMEKFTASVALAAKAVGKLSVAQAEAAVTAQGMAVAEGEAAVATDAAGGAAGKFGKAAGLLATALGGPAGVAAASAAVVIGGAALVNHFTDAQSGAGSYKVVLAQLDQALNDNEITAEEYGRQLLLLQGKYGIVESSADKLKGSISTFNTALGLTGDKALSSAASMIELNSAIAALPASKRIVVQVALVTQATQDYNAAGFQGPALPANFGQNLTGKTDSQVAAEKNKAAKSTADQLIADLKNQLAGLNKAGDAAGSAAGKAASTAADKITAAKSTITDALKAFATDVTTETPKQIRSALNSIRKQFDKLAKLEGVPHIKLDKLIELDSTKLQKFAKQVDVLTKAVEAEKNAITSAFSSGQDFTSITTVASDLYDASKSIAGSAADLSHLRIIKPGQDTLNTLGKTVAGIQSGLDAVTASIKDKTAQLAGFAANAQKALKAGLNPETEAQLLAAGPTAANLQLAQQLANATPAQIAALNAAQKAADAASAAVAKIAGAVAGPAATIGNQIVDGLIAGLKDKKKLDELKKVMQDLANTLVAAIKKALKIKSPSRVMHEIGTHVGAGLHLGMNAKLGAISSAAKDMAAAAVPSIAPVDIKSLAGMADLQAKLQLDAALAPSKVQLLAPKSATQGLTAAQGDVMIGHLSRIGEVPAQNRVYQPTPALASPAVMPSMSTQFAARRAR